MGWMLLLGLIVGTDDVAVTGSARQAASANFRIDSRTTAHDAREVARNCEAWRAKLLATWRPDADTIWKVPCTVVIHPARQSYVAAVGRGGNYSFGSSWIEFKQELVSRRQIDLLADDLGVLSALPHELTHAVIADFFGGKQLPRWADEGMAILADSGLKRQLHQRDLNTALQQRKAFHAAELLSAGDYPELARIPAFYGQSASLVAFLCRRDKPARFLEFVQLAMQKGNEAALRDVYDLRGHAELEQRWREDLAGAVNFHGFQLVLVETPATPIP